MNGFLLLIVIVFLLPYLVVPILIRRNQFFSLKPKMRPVINGFLPPMVEKFFDESAKNLLPLGFEHRIDAVSLDYGPNTRVFLRLYVESQKSLTAICTSLLPDGEKIPIRNFMEFNSRFIDGREVSTHNSDLFSAPLEHHNKTVTALPLSTTPNILLQIHEHVLTKLGLKQQTAFIPKIGQEFDFLVQSFQDDLARQASLGCLYLDRAHHSYRPTWAGAILIGWYSMWPISPIRRVLQKIRAKIQIKALEKANA